jgi:predicted enzyme related to lactoylglutathione lyase
MMLSQTKISIHKSLLKAVLFAVFLPVSVYAQNQGSQLATAADVVGSGNYIHIVEDLDRTLAFYQDLLGAEPNGGSEPRAFGALEPVLQMYNAVGTEFRGATIPVPNTDLGMEFLEWRGVQRPVLEPNFFDHGSPIFLLFVRDIEASIASVITNGGSIITPTVGAVGTGSRFILVQDPDGYFIEILQLESTTASGMIGNVLSGGFRFTVGDANQTAQFYNDAFGFELPEAEDFVEDSLLGAITGLGIANSRLVFGMVPSSNLNVELLELIVDGEARIHQELPGIGSSMLRVFVRDLDVSISKSLAAGAVLAASNEQAVTFGNGMRMQIIEDLDGLLLQLVERP